MGAGLAGRPPCLPHSQIPYKCWVSWETSLSTRQSGSYGCWVSWETSMSVKQSGPSAGLVEVQGAYTQGK